MSTYVTFAIFPIVLFFLTSILVVGAPVAMALQDYYKNRGRNSVKCPENGQTADVEVDNRFAFRMSLRGQQHSRLESCSRWPEKGECAQDCLAQLDPSPENLERLLSKWSGRQGLRDLHSHYYSLRLEAGPPGGTEPEQ